MFELLKCPKTNNKIYQEGKHLKVEKSKITYELKEGIIDFLKDKNQFYEGAYTATVNYLPANDKWFNSLSLFFVNSGYLSQVKNQIPEGSTVLELGCGGGVKFFGSRYKMIGLDLSLGSLKCLPATYSLRLKADASTLPFLDKSIDAIISSFFWEHIEPEMKRVMLKEFYRVLKPGGKMVFFYDLENQNPLISAYRKKYPKKYIEEFLEQDGHLGYQTLEANEEIFREENFKIIKNIPLQRSLFQSSSVFKKLKKADGLFKLSGFLGTFLNHKPTVYKGKEALITIFDYTLGRILPKKYSRITITVLQKD